MTPCTIAECKALTPVSRRVLSLACLRCCPQSGVGHGACGTGYALVARCGSSVPAAEAAEAAEAAAAEAAEAEAEAAEAAAAAVVGDTRRDAIGMYYDEMTKK